MTNGGEFGTLLRVVVKHARTAFADPDEIARDWKALNFTAPPDVARAAARPAPRGFRKIIVMLRNIPLANRLEESHTRLVSKAKAGESGDRKWQHFRSFPYVRKTHPQGARLP